MDQIVQNAEGRQRSPVKKEVRKEANQQSDAAFQFTHTTDSSNADQPLYEFDDGKQTACDDGFISESCNFEHYDPDDVEF